MMILSEAAEHKTFVIIDGPDQVQCNNCGFQIRMNDIVAGRFDHLTKEEKDERQLGVFGLIGMLGTIIALIIFSDFPWLACIFIGLFFGVVPGALLYQLSKLFRIVILLISIGSVSASNAQDPYTKFIENNTKINWAAEYRSIVNLTPVTNTVSLKKYYLDRIKKQGVRSYQISDHTLKDSFVLTIGSLNRQEWLKDHYVRPSDHPDRWEYRSKKSLYGYRIGGLSEDSCCGCDEADAFLVDQLLLYSAGRFTTRNIFLSPLCLRQVEAEKAAWYPVGKLAWNTSGSRTTGSTYLTKSTVTYKIDPHDSTYHLDVLTVGDNLLMNHVLADIKAGKLTAHDYDTDKKIRYEELLTWKMPYDTVAVYDDDFSITSYQVVQKMLDASDFSSIRLEQDWYFDFKAQRLFSEVRSVTLMVDIQLPDGRVIGMKPFVRLKFKSP